MTIKIFSTPTCSFCHQAKVFFKENNIEYTDIDVSENKEAADEMVKKSEQMGVPVIVFEKDGKEEVIVGFQEEKIRELVGI